ncbi:LuxR C-terminal-related transcriptional regulator [Filimonas effusa]|uniref:LuxR family transcriptional regulator n=1 Tax=Filimonas effusa TaxID=2508721 RepID=A0A4Q1D1P1_9BACT|nr:LuxR C-terminal-related transcriptional regulator [Filimonas effusa]RXK81704.1 LuxR family transcriptional regulator [Filimonas effusa]
MGKQTLVFYNEVRKVWEEVTHNVAYTPLEFQLEIHKKLLNLFQPGNYYYFIFNVSNAEFEFVSEQIQSILGYDVKTLKASDFLNRIHAEDQPYFIAFEKQLVNFFSKLPQDKILKYKVQYDFRVRDSNDNYKRILHQLVIIEHNNSNLLRSLGIHTDITHLKPSGTPTLSFIGLDNEPSYYNVPPDQPLLTASKERFTRREKQIIRFVLSGKNSHEIAQTLHISKHTVDTHRKKILSKSGCASWVEMSARAVTEAWV